MVSLVKVSNANIPEKKILNCKVTKVKIKNT